MYSPDHAAHTPATAHNDDRVQYLVVGDESSLSELEAEIALLPLCARGRVFIEVASEAQIADIRVPMRMTVAWLPRSARAGAPGTAESCPRGQAALRAVTAWSAEMLCDGAGATSAVLTGDYRLVSDVFDHLTDVVGMPVQAVHAPERFGLRA